MKTNNKLNLIFKEEEENMFYCITDIGIYLVIKFNLLNKYYNKFCEKAKTLEDINNSFQHDLIFTTTFEESISLCSEHYYQNIGN